MFGCSLNPMHPKAAGLLGRLHVCNNLSLNCMSGNGMIASVKGRLEGRCM